MRQITLAVLSFLVSANAAAYSRGTLVCYFDLVSTKNPAQVVRTPAFEFDIMEVRQDSFEYDALTSPIRFRYTPGLVSKNNVGVFVIDMTYRMANAGVDVPAMANGTYVVKIGRQDSDLIGAFLSCTAKGLE